MRIPKDHPRYDSLMARERLAKAMEREVVTPTGMISHGRGEAYDYLLGESTVPPADLAERVAAAHLLESRRPVLCVNGNTAALAGREVADLAAVTGAKVEVNLFHRSPERMDAVIGHMESFGVDVLGRDPDDVIPGIASDRARCTREGIGSADVILVPIEDGDRAGALVAMGKVVIAVDLNPLSRTSRTASVTIVDEVTRALPAVGRHHASLASAPAERRGLIDGFDNLANLAEVMDIISRRFRHQRE